MNLPVPSLQVSSSLVGLGVGSVTGDGVGAEVTGDTTGASVIGDAVGESI